MTERSFGPEAPALQAASAQARHFRGGSGLVEEDQPVRHGAPPKKMKRDRPVCAAHHLDGEVINERSDFKLAAQPL
jgi:hypothetical protein